MKRVLYLLSGILGAFLAQGCCSTNPSNNTTTCSVTFSNACSTQGTISGYVVFTGAATIARGAAITVQYSTDSFATVVTPGTVMVNNQGMVAVPFSFPIGVCSNMNIQLRAFQDTNFTGTWVNGEPTGRYDGTDSGNATFKTVSLTTSVPSAGGLVIFLDGTGPQ